MDTGLSDCPPPPRAPPRLRHVLPSRPPDYSLQTLLVLCARKATRSYRYCSVYAPNWSFGPNAADNDPLAATFHCNCATPAGSGKEAMVSLPSGPLKRGAGVDRCQIPSTPGCNLGGANRGIGNGISVGLAATQACKPASPRVSRSKTFAVARTGSGQLWGELLLPATSCLSKRYCLYRPI